MGTKTRPGEFDCYASAGDDEPMFVLLARDEDAPGCVEAWARARFERIARTWCGVRSPDRYDHAHKEELTRELRKIAEALQCAGDMRRWRRVNVEATLRECDSCSKKVHVTSTGEVLDCQGNPSSGPCQVRRSQWYSPPARR